MAKKMFSSEFKAKVAIEALKGHKTTNVHIPTHLDHQFRTMLITDSNPS